ncbi:hypothetical protein ABK040_013830 [Willaertia magna]
MNGQDVKDDNINGNEGTQATKSTDKKRVTISEAPVFIENMENVPVDQGVTSPPAVKINPISPSSSSASFFYPYTLGRHGSSVGTILSDVPSEDQINTKKEKEEMTRTHSSTVEELMDKWGTTRNSEERRRNSVSRYRGSIDNPTINYHDIKPATALDEKMRNFYNRPSLSNVIKDEKSALTPSGNAGAPNEHKAKPRAHLFGMFEGVFVPCVEAVLGTILFLKVPWIVARAGLLYSLLYVFISVFCSLITWLSMSAVVTNGTISSGGPYIIFSRLFGYSFGGSLGLIYFLGFICLSSLHCFGAAHLLHSTIHNFYPNFTMLDTDPFHTYWDTIIFAVGFLFIVTLVVFIGIKHVSRLELLFLLVVFVTIILFIIGCFVVVRPEYHIHGVQWENFLANFPPPTYGFEFFSIMAVIFPSVTGIMAGINRSGDLSNSSRDIPRGTIAALITSTLIYLLIFILIAFVGDRSVMLTETEFFAYVSFPYYGYGVGTLISKIGILIALLGEALQALLVAPRVLQAVSADGIFPSIPFKYFARTSSSGEPRRAIVFSSLLAILPLFLGNLESISTLIAMFILLCYAFINLATFVASFLDSPNWRPRWKLYHWFVGLMGFIICGVIMFLVAWYWALLAFVLGLIFYLIIELKTDTSSFGDSMKGMKLQSALNAIYSCDTEEVSKNWRPQLLCLVKLLPDNSVSHPEILHLAGQLKKGRGLCIVTAVIEGEFRRKSKQAQKEKEALSLKMKEMNIKGFANVIVARTYQEGIKYLIQASGLGGLTPNSVISGYPHHWKENKIAALNFVDMVQYCEHSDKAVIVSKGDFQHLDEELEGNIDLFWIIYDGGLELLISFLLTKHKVWKKCSLRIFTLADQTENIEECQEKLQQLMFLLRIDAVCNVIQVTPSDLSAYTYNHKAQIRKREELRKKLNLNRTESIIDDLASLAHIDEEYEETSSDEENIENNEEVTITIQEKKKKRKLSFNDYLETSKKINNTIRKYLDNTQLVLINLPTPSSHITCFQYMEYLDELTQSLDRVLMIRGSGKEVITHVF